MRLSLPVSLMTTALLLASCGTKESDGAGAGPPSSAQTGPGAATGQASLATLDAKTGQPETWTLDETPAPVPLLFFAQASFKLSASCKQPDGSLDCAAFKYVSRGMPTEIAKRELDDHRRTPGMKVCLKLNNQVVNGHNAVGSQETFCRFPDGSVITASALEQYTLRIIQ
jgi:hypothetical protein